MWILDLEDNGFKSDVGIWTGYLNAVNRPKLNEWIVFETGKT